MPETASDPLVQFLAAVRRPLEFLAAAPATTAARTHLPGRELAARGRAVRTRLAEGPQRAQLDALCERLEQREGADPSQRRALAGECRGLLTQLASPAAPRPAPEQTPSYRAASGDLSAALTRLSLSVQFA